jgi:anti-anti-sigma factor
MVVDLAGVDSIDIAGLGELVLTQMWADASGYILKLAGAKNSVHRLFESTNLVSVFDVHGTVLEAIAAMCPPEEQLA